MEVQKDDISRYPDEKFPYGVCTKYPNNAIGQTGYVYLKDEKTAFEFAEELANEQNVGVAVFKLVGFTKHREVKKEKPG